MITSGVIGIVGPLVIVVVVVIMVDIQFWLDLERYTRSHAAICPHHMLQRIQKLRD